MHEQSIVAANLFADSVLGTHQHLKKDGLEPN